MPVVHLNLETRAVLFVQVGCRFTDELKLNPGKFELRVTSHDSSQGCRLTGQPPRYYLSIVYYYWGRLINVTSQWHRLPRYSVETVQYYE